MINTRTRVAALFAGLLTVLAVALSTTSASASTMTSSHRTYGHRDGCQRRREGDDEDQVGIDDGEAGRHLPHER